MANRKDRRKAAAIRRHARPTKADQRQLVTRIAILVAALAALVILISLGMCSGR